MDGVKIGFVVGLAAEAALLRGTRFMVAVGGGRPAGAAAAASRLIELGAEGLVSFGLAGGLDAALAPGSVVVPRAVLEAGRAYDCDPGLVQWLGGANAAVMFAGGDIVVSAAEKGRLFAESGAAAVDLESGAVALVAAARGVKFAVLRAVADPAWRDLPPAALIALNSVGKIGFLRVLGSVLREPGQVPGLLGLARDAGAARRALVVRVRGLG